MNRILVVEDDRDIAELIGRYPGERRPRGAVPHQWRRSHGRGPAHAAGLLILDLMLPQRRRPGNLPRRARRSGDRRHPDHHADRARRRIGPHRRPRTGRRRLRHQAVLAQGTGGPRQCPAAPHQTAGVWKKILRYAPAIDLIRHLVFDDTREVKLTAKEFLLLAYFSNIAAGCCRESCCCRTCGDITTPAARGLTAVHGAAGRKAAGADRRDRDDQAVWLQTIVCRPRR